ncbi:hypothetical protein TVAG_403720 [Trichomonas vaginalis G3]|uniref:Uncharacterized protein n=1 Tax=Trichomonas vaginalis (strain ATCC PRA-98 / G3) TaxID=412133 RepID=A2ELQ0_TRIV3|nr:hypothetical protein TVAGG3_0894990 [Trichomonas vaginalis G3]EAY06415.1 hypothetical protein TVAG_403720 [Trichomonas vaginalis G3]KAI5503003.1 hypothetical protein TVAGG3_0894990 [Trichomonas vaginalis G3]|eukprot:XP_001318638.1 hypothetical protein [Trichomonas vaginalis G3]
MNRKPVPRANLSVLDRFVPEKPQKSSRSASEAQKYFAKKELPPLVSYETAGQDNRLQKPITKDIHDYNPDDPMIKIGEVTDRIGAVVKGYEASQDEARFKDMQTLDMQFNVRSLDSKQILDESKSIVDELINKNKELKDNQSTQLTDISTWLNDQKSKLSSDTASSETANYIDPALQIASEEAVTALSNDTVGMHDKVNRVMKLHSEFAAKSYLNIHQMEIALQKKDAQIKELMQINESLQNNAAHNNKRNKNQPNKDMKKKLDQSLEKIAQQEEMIKSLNARISELIGKSVIINTGNNSQPTGDDNGAYQHQQAAAYLTVKLEESEMLVNKLKNQITDLQHEIEIKEMEKSIMNTQILALNERIDALSTKNENLLNELIIEKDSKQNSERSQNTERSTMEDLFKKKIKELEAENNKLQEEMTNKLKNNNQEYKKQLKEIQREYELREVEARNQLMKSAASVTNNDALMKSVEQNFQRKFEILEKQYQDKMQRMEEENKEKYNAMQQNYLDEITRLKHSLDSKLSDNEATKLIFSQLEEEKTKRGIKEAELKAEYATKLENVQNEFRSYMEKLEASNKEKDDQIFKLKQNLENSENKISDLNSQIEKLSVFQVQNNPPPVTVVEQEVPKEEPETNNTDINNAVLKAKRDTESQYIKKLAQQKDTMDKYYQAELDKLKEQLGELKTKNTAKEEENSNLRESIVNLQSQLQQKDEDSSFTEEINHLKAEIDRQNDEYQKLQSQKMKLEVDNDILQKSLQAKDDGQMLTDLTENFRKSVEELQNTKDELEAYKKRYKTIQKIHMDSLNKPKTLLELDFEYIFNYYEPIIPQPAQEVIVKQINAQEQREIRLSLQKEIVAHYVPIKKNLELSEYENNINLLHSYTKLSLSNEVINTDIERKSPEKSSRKTPEKSERNTPEISEKPKTVLTQSDSVEIFQDEDKELSSTDTQTDALKPEIIEKEKIVEKEKIIEKEPQIIEREKIIEKEPQIIEKEKIVEKLVERPEVPKQSVAVYVNLIGNNSNLSLETQPNIEIFAINENGEITPEIPPTIDPEIPELPEEKQQIEMQIMTNEGTIIDIPTVEEITEETDHAAVATASIQRIEETKALSKKLALVVSELQAIEEESDPQKKLQMQNSIGVTLDIEKDSLISQMKERISELEEMNKRHIGSLSIETNTELNVNKSPTPVSSSSKRPQLSITSNQIEVTNQINEKQNDFANEKDVVVRNDVMTSPNKMMRTPTVNELVENECQVKPETDEAVTQTQKQEEVEKLDNVTQTQNLLQTTNVSIQTEQENIPKIKSVFYASTMETQTMKPEISLEDTGNTFSVEEKQKTDVQINTDVVEKVDIGFSVEEMPKQTRKTINLEKIENVKRKIRSTIEKTASYTINVPKKDDPRIEQFETQRKQLNELKQQLVMLQAAKATELKQTVDEIQKTLNDAGNSMTEIANKGIQMKKEEKTKQMTMNAKNAIENAQNITRLILENTKSKLGSQLQLVDSFTKVSTDKLINTQKLNDLSLDLSQNVVDMKSELMTTEQLDTAFSTAVKQVQEQEKEILKLQKDLEIAKKAQNEPDGAQLVRKAQGELEELLYGNPNKNKLFNSNESAMKVINEIAKRSKNNTLIQAVGASLILDNVEKMTEKETPQPQNIYNSLTNVIEMLNERTINKRAQEMTQNLRDRIQFLEKEIQRNETEKMMVNRDLSLLKATQMNEKIANDKKVQTLEEQKILLERQIEDLSKLTDVALKESHQNEILKDKQLRETESMLQDKSKALLETEKRYNDLKSRFDELFNQANDAEVDNKSLRNRVDEIVFESQMNKKKASEFEKQSSSLNNELDNANNKLSDAVKLTHELEAKLEQIKMENESLKNQLLEKMVNDSISKVPNAKNDMSKAVKLYKDRLIEFEQALKQRVIEYIDLKNQRATDQKQIIQLRRESNRHDSEMKIQKMRYDCAKDENAHLVKSIMAREETIRILKREIERLRNLLRMQKPLKENLKYIEKMKAETSDEIQKQMRQLENLQKQNKLLGTNASTRFFDRMIEQQRKSLARAQALKEEITQREQKARMMALDASALLVRENELSIPEEVVMKYMPKPEPSQKVKMMQQNRQFVQQTHINGEEIPQQTKSVQNENQSYAESLQILGELSGKVDSKALRGMLKDARHGQIVIPGNQKTIKGQGSQVNNLYVKSSRK